MVDTGRGFFYNWKLKRIVNKNLKRWESEPAGTEWMNREYLIRHKNPSRMARQTGCPSETVMQAQSPAPYRPGDEIGVGLVVVKYLRDAPFRRRP